MFRIKICGITNVDDALHAARAGADAVGLNFYAASRRACSPEAARQIVEQLPAGVRKVGVFVNAPTKEVRATADALALDLVQLHGDEPPEALRELRGLAVIRAFRPGRDFSGVSAYLARCHALAAMPRMVLVDALVKDAYGGTGEMADWHAIAQNRSSLTGVPLVLAGGLTPANVAEAIAVVRPWAVDVAGGVEQAPGRKSHVLVSEFVTNARLAFARPAPRG